MATSDNCVFWFWVIATVANLAAVVLIVQLLLGGLVFVAAAVALVALVATSFIASVVLATY